ncbi:bifunctional diaminohydroxyphosphoribosylaminopyrimidine deaminase/5-amino-6-(5-phosphoribosylamino)uracil reductase RibD [Hanstruepera neustonica]|uniref:Riboflavin biosynthesis protein RibD n=1 Tax=Hanstruepera neustonica TaxID=1445657 RepID=A0A2K1DXE7_9FLAO|nr:bifunctional diaminohydroxyphosphoribosylaminopyrimidine deaminase/5-amino-6-(5-phosphoribosylamino)uracil reductase RibD [Hanstruepera neustonica]PNQ72696.1 bifunctional diaminohydroxyphosphoribosylaminopyrimidine deaminase/5-amino-6-(5-phosphoribosylamino)uracil reductase RibD [Hanstruepera neustonica]
MKIHEKYINRCIEIAKNGLGTTAPNPMVGCVIVHEKTIIGEGFTSQYGGPHAEVKAIESVTNKELLKLATLYVTLEPCSHFGKTPPCADLIVEYKIPKVVIGTIDIHSKVAGKGIERLKNAGCEVIVGVLEDVCKEHHKRFFTFHNKKRPYIILKWAQSADGFISPKSKPQNKPVWISNSASQQLVHKWRTEEQAILIGTKTAIDDNPSLTARKWQGRNPIRIVLDRTRKLPSDLNVFNKEATTIIISDQEIDFKNNVPANICSYLYKQNIQSVIIEGGSKTLQSFIDANLWDEARIFTGPKLLKAGTPSPHFDYKPTTSSTLLNDTLKIYING